MERYRGKGGLDYIPAIEGLHGAHRYHIHLVADYRQLSPAEVRFLWQCGEVTDWPVFKRQGKALGYRYLARYLTKERSDGIIIPVGRHPWSCSRSLRAKLPPPEVWLDEIDAITIPFDAMLPRVRTGGSQFGSYRVASWIEA